MYENNYMRENNNSEIFQYSMQELNLFLASLFEINMLM